MQLILVAYLKHFSLKKQETELLPLLSDREVQKYHSFVSPKRRKEWLAVRFLLMKHLEYMPQIEYLPSGQPYLKNKDLSISVSHSKDYAVVCLDREPCAIDVDLLSRNYEKIAQRFLSPYEMKYYAQDHNKLAASWMAKEAMYKLLHRDKVIFAEHLRVFINKSITNFGYFYGEYLPDRLRVRFTYYRIDTNLIVLARYE